MLSPVASLLNSIQRDARNAQEDSRLIKDSKHRQRKLNSETLYDISLLSRRIREIKSDIDATVAAVDSLQTAASECKRLSVVAMRMSAFWRQVHSNMGRLSSQRVVYLIEATSGELKAPAEAASDPLPSSEGPRAAGSVEIERDIAVCLAPGESRDERYNHMWKPCTALRRQLVLYYARWAALADVSAECVAQISSSRADAALELSGSLSEAAVNGTDLASAAGPLPDAESSNGHGEVGVQRESRTELARRAVEALAADLQREMSEIDRARHAEERE
jgi:hypothetical protein